jgi:short-subunit dehydrogenase
MDASIIAPMTWIVTGASRGLGRHLKRQLAERGHAVLAIARDAARLNSLAAAHPGRITPLPLDLADAASVAPAMARALEALPRIDGVVNNAGFGAYKPFVEHTEAESLALVQVNFTAAVQMCHAVLPRLLQQRRGHIVHIASDLARRPPWPTWRCTPRPSTRSPASRTRCRARSRRTASRSASSTPASSTPTLAPPTDRLSAPIEL